MNQYQPCNCNRPTYQRQANVMYGRQPKPAIPKSCLPDNDNKSSCDTALAMAFVKMQEFDQLYDQCKGLKEGTMFPELNLIFCGRRGNE